MLIRFFVCILNIVLFISCAIAQPLKLLHFTKTSGFDHQTRSVSYNMLTQMGLQNGFIVDDDSTGTTFNSLNNLQQYTVVIFSNTTGDQILDSTQQQNFMQYMNGSGNFIGIHSATDTYRHSTANGTNTGTWDWYAEMLGASVRVNPSHVTGTPVYRIDTLINHTLLNGIPAPWFKAEEYYYWEGGYFDSTYNIVLQKVEQTVGPNGLVNSFDSARAVTWYKILPAGGKVFYTSLGHDVTNYTSDNNFYKLIENTVLWMMNITEIPENNIENRIRIYPNPVNEFVEITTPAFPFIIKISDMQGRLICSKKHETGNIKMDLHGLRAGLYLIALVSEKNNYSTLILKM